MYKPLVSIIIPNYCHAKYLDKRIQSVLNQTYQNFEVIILDDASPDNGASKTIIEKYRKNPHVNQIEYNNINSGSTFKQWNKGICLAKGELIWIAESDDYCDLDLLELLVPQICNNYNVSIATCNSQWVDEDEKIIGYKYSKSEKKTFYNGKDFIKNRMIKGNGICNASSAIFRKEHALSINKQYIDYTAAGDRLFWIELAEKGNVVYCDAAKNYFRQHQNKVSPRKISNGTTSIEDYHILRYLEKKGYVKFSNHFVIRDKYLADINNTQFESEEIRKYLIKLWTYQGIISQKSMWHLLNIYYHLTKKGEYHHFK